MDCFVDVVIDCKWITVEKKRKGWDPAVNVLVKIRGACFRFIFTITIIEYWENQVRGVQRKFTYKPPLTLTYTTLFTILTFATLPWFWPQKPPWTHVALPNTVPDMQPGAFDFKDCDLWCIQNPTVNSWEKRETTSLLCGAWLLDQLGMLGKEIKE